MGADATEKTSRDTNNQLVREHVFDEKNLPPLNCKACDSAVPRRRVDYAGMYAAAAYG